MDIKEIRRTNLRTYIKQFAGDNQRKFADQYDLNAAHISQMVTGHREVGDKIARKLERALKLTFGQMDHTPSELSPDEWALIRHYRSASPSHRMATQNFLRATPEQRDMLSENMLTEIFKNHVPDEHLSDAWVSPEALKKKPTAGVTKKP